MTAAIIKARKVPLPWFANATGAMINIDAVGVIPDTVTQILPSTPIARASCCSYLRVPVLCGLTTDMEQASFASVYYWRDRPAIRRGTDASTVKFLKKCLLSLWKEK